MCDPGKRYLIVNVALVTGKGHGNVVPIRCNSQESITKKRDLGKLLRLSVFSCLFSP